MQNKLQRNFILQQGFQEPAPAACPVQYSSLMFQPRIVFIWLAVGILFQSAAIFAVLCAVLWWNALLPKLNLFDLIYNATVGRRPTALRLAPAPAPRRFSQAMAGAFAIAIALLLHAGLNVAANVIEGIFLAAALALTLGGLCLGSFIYHTLTGRGKFARKTLPWAS